MKQITHKKVENCNRVFFATVAHPAKDKGEQLYVEVDRAVVLNCIDFYGSKPIAWRKGEDVYGDDFKGDIFIEDIA